MNILLVGAGGYAAGYVKELLGNTDPSVTWAGVVDPYYDACAKKAEIDAAGIPIYDTMEAFYAEHHADYDTFGCFLNMMCINIILLKCVNQSSERHY